MKCYDESKELLCDLEISDIPHLDAIFVFKKKNYKIISWKNVGTTEKPEYQAIVTKVGKEE